MPYANLSVVCTCRATGRTLAVCAEGLTPAAARSLAAQLRADDAANEATVGYGLRTMSLSRQIELGEAAGLILAAADETSGAASYRLAA